MRDVIEQMLNAIEREHAVQGAFLTGSYARNAPLKTSDIDLFIIVSGDWRKKEIRHLEGYEFELFFNPVWKLDQELDESVSQGDSSTVSILRDAVILRDLGGELVRLKSRALGIWNGGPPAWTSLEQELTRYRISDLVKDAEDMCVSGNPDSFKILVGIVLREIMEAHFGLRCQWLPKHKYLLDEFLRCEPEERALVGSVLDGDMDSLYQLADQSLAPAGGLIHGDWALPVEQLSK